MHVSVVDDSLPHGSGVRPRGLELKNHSALLMGIHPVELYLDVGVGMGSLRKVVVFVANPFGAAF